MANQLDNIKVGDLVENFGATWLLRCGEILHCQFPAGRNCDGDRSNQRKD